MVSEDIIERNGFSIWFCAQVTRTNATKLCRLLLEARLKMLSAQHAMPDEHRHITLYIMSHGGEAHPAFAVVDCMKALGVPVHTVVMGIAASAAATIAVAGAHRAITLHSDLLIHQVSAEVSGGYNDLQVGIDNCTQTMQRLVSFYVEHSNCNQERVIEELKHDRRLSAQQAVEAGLMNCCEFLLPCS